MKGTSQVTSRPPSRAARIASSEARQLTPRTCSGTPHSPASVRTAATATASATAGTPFMPSRSAASPSLI